MCMPCLLVTQDLHGHGEHEYIGDGATHIYFCIFLYAKCSWVNAIQLLYGNSRKNRNVGLWWGFKQLDCNGNSVTLRDTAVLAIDNNSIDSYTKQPGTLSN